MKLDRKLICNHSVEIMNQNEAEFQRTAPKWHLGQQTWDIFQADFAHSARRCGIQERLGKSVLYSNIKGEAKALIVPHMDLDLPHFRDMKFHQYAQELKAVFQPVNDAPMLRLVFTTRTQGQYEHVLKYVQHKFIAFMAAYPQSQPLGTLNTTKPPEPLNNYMGYRDQVSRLLQARQADYLSGNLKDSDMIGIEIDVLMNPVDYKVSNSMAAKEAVYSLDKDERDTINALGDARTCFYCGKRGHV